MKRAKTEDLPLEGKHIAILHPDLGIGGAEQLIINIGLALQDNGATVRMYTPRYDTERCFQDSKQLDVEVRGSIFPRSIFGRCFALCAYIRMLLCALHVAIFAGGYDCIILDQVSFPIPILRLVNRNVVFYCHHPDKLLCTERRSLFKRIYRYVLDTVEEWTTGMARKILVNSEYTKEVYHQAFPSLRTSPDILYPCIKEDSFIMPPDYNSKKVIHKLLDIPEDQQLPHIITSLNRYERKKNIGLAIRSFRSFLNNNMVKQKDFILVIAGGYDTAVQENVEHYEELVSLAEGLANVCFLRSISNEERLTLLKYTDVVTYTPENEHFGIVPVEAMYMGCIVFACNSGGPTESIVDGKTGFLLDSDDVEKWGKKLHDVFYDTSNEKLLDQMKEQAKARVEEEFSFKAFGEKLQQYVTI